MKTSNPFRASRIPLALSASLLLASTAAQGQTSFSAFFNNGTGIAPNNFGDKLTSQYNWAVAAGSAGALAVSPATAVSGGRTDTAGVPVVDGSTTAGFVFHVPAAEVASEAALFYRTSLDTSDALQDAPQGNWYRSGTATLSGRTLSELSGLSVYTRPGSTATVMRFAIQTGGVWYASATSFTQTDLNLFEQKTITPSTENWIPDVGTPETSLDTDLSDNGTPAALDGASVITGYGWYADTDALTGDAARVRIDSFVISSSASGPVAVPTSIVVTPAAAVVDTSGTQQFSAELRDQSNQPIVPQPASFSWSVSGGGTIDANGLFTAGTTAGSFTVTANAVSIDGSTGFTVLPPVVSDSTTFTQFFNNGTGTGGDNLASAHLWNGSIGTAGADVTAIANVGVSQGNTHTIGVPVVTGISTTGGFLFALPADNASEASILYTTNLNSSTATPAVDPQTDWYRVGTASLATLTVGDVDRLSFYARNGTTAPVMRLALLVDGTWYVSTSSFQTTQTANFELFTLDSPASINWYQGAFVAGTSLSADVTALPSVSLSSSALVEGYGVYADIGGTAAAADARVRIDSFEITSSAVTSADAYDTWAGGTFANAFPEAQRGAELDYDNDGLSNLLEFVLGGDPTLSEPGIAPEVVTASVGDLVVTFDRSDEAELQPVAVKVQVSSDLVTWSPADDIAISDVSDAGPIGGTGASYTVTENGVAPDTITVTIPKGAATKKFARVVATQ